MTPNADPIAGLRDQLTALLWQVYGYPGALSDAHPVTQEKYRADAAAVLEVIEGAGYRVVPNTTVCLHEGVFEDLLPQLDPDAYDWFGDGEAGA
jgi:hypothetical protein